MMNNPEITQTAIIFSDEEIVFIEKLRTMSPEDWALFKEFCIHRDIFRKIQPLLPITSASLVLNFDDRSILRSGDMKKHHDFGN